MRRPLPNLLLIACVMFFSLQLPAQRIFVNSLNGLFEMTGGVGSCTYTPINSFCIGNFGGQIFSSAVYKDTLYFISNSENRLYRVKLGDPNGCSYVTSFPLVTGIGSSLNSLTVDKNGVLYGADVVTNDLHRYNPYTNTMDLVGTLPFKPGGDLLFFKDKLLLSTVSSGICEINLADPSQSQVYMPTVGYSFFGLISFPFQCGNNKVYGFAPASGGSTSLVELDLDNKVVIGLVCTMPFIVYDGASEVENGATIGVSIDSIFVSPPCGNQTTGNVRIKAFSAAAGQLTYILDNSVTNNNGIFSNVSIGTHQVKVKTEGGCQKDSTFTVSRGLSSVQLALVNPVGCDQQNGSITVSATSSYLPLTYSINNGPAQTNSQFNNLPGGAHTITVRDAGGCRRDTTVVLTYLSRPDFITGISTTPASCESNTGSITVHVSGSASGVTASLNNTQAQAQLVFLNLAAGQYLVSVFKQGSCRFDTLVNVLRQEGTRPAITIVTENQMCSDNNGKITVSAAGAGAPFTFNFNNTGFSNNPVYDKVGPGTYTVKIQDQFKCNWDTSAIVLPYNRQPVEIAVVKTDADCMHPKSGQIRVNVTGSQQPYLLQWEGQLYANGTTFTADAGRFLIPIINSDRCTVDTARITLDLIIKPECDKVYIPNAFSPNNDRHNDVFRIIYGAALKNIVLRIYNRYGQLVYEDVGGKNSWNGTMNGKALSSGTYVWTLSYDNYLGEKKHAKGFVLLVR